MARFFIDRPVFAWVIALMIMLAGAVSLLNLPVSQYPAIAPPEVKIEAFYPGASAKAMEDSVTQPIEQALTGLDGLIYMSSSSDSYGHASIKLTFDTAVDPDIAQVNVQNKMQTVLPQLPQSVQQQGVQIETGADNFFMVVGFVSEDGSMNNVDLSDFAITSIKNELVRVPGVGGLEVFGAPYAMRIWLDPDRLAKYNLMPGDVRAALLAQNAQISAGQLGGLPAVEGQGFTASVTVQSRLRTVEQFKNILLRSAADGAEVRLADVARVEVGASRYTTVARYNGRPAAGVGVRLGSGANALATATAVREKLDELQRYFPQGVRYVIPYDTTPFVKISIEEVVKTLLEAVVLVFLVMYLFLQNFRATLIPTIAVPVVLLGTFAVMEVAGFSINTLTMFGMVLAIGLLVDDAIVVVENVERVMTEEGLSPREATYKSMRQITSALIGIGLVLSAVFIPMAFFPGSTGVIYRQFSITLAAAMGLSVMVAIIFTPALCATLMKPVKKGHEHGEKGLFSGLFHRFNVFFQSLTNGYASLVGGILRRSVIFVLIYLILAGALGYLVVKMPTSFLPEEDQGLMFSQVVLPGGATQQRTLDVLKKVENFFLEKEQENVVSVFSVAGFSFSGPGQNMGIAFVALKPWDQRRRPEQNVKAVTRRAMGYLWQLREAFAFAFVPPAVVELGTGNGFTLQLQDRSGLGHDALVAARNQFFGMAAKDPRLINIRPGGQEDSAELMLDIDHAKAGALGVSVASVNDTLSSAWGGRYVNDFLDRGRVKKVFMQAEPWARMSPDNLQRWYVRNNIGEMVPVSAFTTATWKYGSPQLERFDGFPALEIAGMAGPGYSSGDAMAAAEALVAKLPAGIGHAWSGISYEERKSGAQAPALYALSLIVVFLCLAALYESWSIPLAVMFAVPLGVLGAVLAVTGRGMPNDIYFQVALLATIGLSSKNAILIVEFAIEKIESGKSFIEATLEAIKMRLRPIVMTSLAFGFGVLPLALSKGAGAGSQNAIGTGILGGTIGGTILGLFFVPLFFVIIQRLTRREKNNAGDTPAS